MFLVVFGAASITAVLLMHTDILPVALRMGALCIGSCSDDHELPSVDELQALAISGLAAGLTSCAALEAAVDVHIRHFHKQQDEERRFLRRLPELCQVPASAFYSKLHELRRPMIAAINRHVYAEFVPSDDSVCTDLRTDMRPGVHADTDADVRTRHAPRSAVTLASRWL